MTIRNLTLAVLVFSSANLFAANHLVVMGGSGDPAGATTIFDTNLKNLGTNLQGTNWKYQLSFNGGHANTESIMRNQFGKSVAPSTSFTIENYNKMIADYKKKIISGEITSSDQLMLVIDSHGAEQGYDEKTHSIAATNPYAPKTTEKLDYDKLSGSPTVNLDALEELVKLTNDKGIKLAIIDMSCHAGNTLALKKNAPNTCIVTASGPVHYSFSGEGTFSNNFWKKLKPGMNLEDAFLQARLETNDASYPMISTSENDQITNEVYDTLTPYLYYVTPKVDKLTPYVKKSSNDQVICQRDTDFSSLMSKINQLQQAANGYNGDELKNLLITYKYTQDKMLARMKAVGGPDAEKVEKFEAPLDAKTSKLTKPFSISMTMKELANMTPIDTVNYLQKLYDSEKNPKEKAETLATLNTWKLVKVRYIEVTKKYPGLLKYNSEVNSMVKELNNNRKTAEKIAAEEKKFYNALYMKKKSNINDPCRQIVF